jgi:hypothetical protein
MAQVDSENNISMPVDTKRRRFLAVAAGASVASVGTLAAAAMPATAPESAACADPIFAAIAAHRKAKAASDAAWAEVERLQKLAAETVGPRHVMVLNMAEPGPVKMFEEATSWLDINKLVPRETHPELNGFYQARLKQQTEAYDAITGNTDKITEEPLDAYWDSIDEFIDTVPTTMAGLLAMIRYAAEIEEQEPDAYTRGNPLAAMAQAVKALTGRAARA